MPAPLNDLIAANEAMKRMTADGVIPVVHQLKCHPGQFDALARGLKHFEYRKDDRETPYAVGDILHLHRFDPETSESTGESLIRQVSYKLSGGEFGVPVGYCVLSLGFWRKT